MDKTVEIVVLAMLALFLGLRLFAVLGRRAEQEQEPIASRFDSTPDKPVSGDERGRIKLPPVPRMPDAARGQQPQPMVPGVTPAIERGLKEIAAADRRFDTMAFIDGARGAYRMILEAFWKGDKQTLAPLCDPAVMRAFSAAIDARAAAGETLDNRLVRIEEATLVAASYQAPIARVAMRFTADIAAVTRNAEGQVVAGSLSDAVEARDIWTFSRDVTAQSPDWLLDETDQG